MNSALIIKQINLVTLLYSVWYVTLSGMNEKRCRVCGQIKPIDDFSIRSDTGRRRNECHQCKLHYLKQYRSNPEHKERAHALNKEYRENHREELNKYSKEYQRNHLEDFRIYNKRYRDSMSEEQKQKQNEREKRYRERRKDDPVYLEKKREWDRKSSKRRRKKITAYEQERKKTDLVFRLKKQVRNEVRVAFNRRGFRKSTHTEDIVGTDLMSLYEYLLETYVRRYGEKWDGKTVVHVDHIIPLAMAHSEKDVIRLNHFSNLQLLRGEDNLKKGSKNPLSELFDI